MKWLCENVQTGHRLICHDPEFPLWRYECSACKKRFDVDPIFEENTCLDPERNSLVACCPACGTLDK